MLFPWKFYWRRRLSTVDLLVVWFSSFLYQNINYIFYHTSYLNEEVSCTEPPPTSSPQQAWVRLIFVPFLSHSLDIMIPTFSRFNEKWLRMNEKISFMTINDWYHPFSFAVHEGHWMRFSSTILLHSSWLSSCSFPPCSFTLKWQSRSCFPSVSIPCLFHGTTNEVSKQVTSLSTNHISGPIFSRLCGPLHF